MTPTSQKIDMPLALHEVGHVLADTLDGADLIFVRNRTDEQGYYADVVGISTSQEPAGRMPFTARGVIAGPVASLLFDERFDNLKDDVVLQLGSKSLDICNISGICPDDIEDSRQFDKALLSLHAREMALVLMANRDLVFAFAEHIVDCLQRGKTANFKGAPTLAMLNAVPDAAEMSKHIQLFSANGGVREMAAHHASLSQPVSIEFKQDLALGDRDWG